MDKDRLMELLREREKELESERKELELNPLAQYSTTELKKELRRRKGEWD